MTTFKRAALLLLCFSFLAPASGAAPAGKTGTKPEYLNWLEAARNGEPEKEYPAGLAFYQGIGGAPRDYGKALEWFSRAAGHGNYAACVRLGDMYALGQGAEKDEKKAFDWYLKAANSGNSEGMEKLADAYLNGKSLGENYAEAAKWYAKAAEASSLPDPAFKLARLYYLGGPGLNRDEEKALQLFLKAFEFGQPDAAYYISGIYEVRGEYAKAGDWLLKGSEKGSAIAMFYLAKAHLGIEEYNGKRLVPPDAAQAYKWLYVLTRKEYQPRFDELLKKTASKLNKSERKKAETEAAPLISRLVGKTELKSTVNARKAHTR
ncbi:MAG: tetratricopeptide repeat protein [Elusimicrobia bacterium]|nr:tetratricopeptide repeat protein [Elusimicrobiota bacterium]